MIPFQSLRDEERGEREMKSGCGENRRRVGKPMNQANPRQNGASWPELIPMVSSLAKNPSSPSCRPALSCSHRSKLGLLNASIKYLVEPQAVGRGTDRRCGLTGALRDDPAR